MYILYLDESGHAANLKEEHFVIAGVAVPESSLNFLTEKLNKVAENINPENPDNIELHAAGEIGAS